MTAWRVDTWPTIDKEPAREYACDGCGCIWWGPQASRPNCPVCDLAGPHACDTFGWSYTWSNETWRKAFRERFQRHDLLAVAELTPPSPVYLYRVPLAVCRLQWEALGRPGALGYGDEAKP